MPDNKAAEEAVFGKISRRLVWFLLLLFIINFIDRTNIGFAALTMNKDLGLSATTFGLALSLFSLGYVLFEIPSNMALAHFGARIWLARIMITWGIAATACALAQGPWSLIGLRVLVGIAEAGFAPGLILYITYWYPQYRRARIQTGFLIAQPIAVSFGSLISGMILAMDGLLGVAGWRWLFFLEGIPAVIFGVVALFYLADRPSKAKFLSASERDMVEGIVHRDAMLRERQEDAGTGVWRLILTRNMILISLSYMTLVFNFTAAAYWLPQIIKAMVPAGTAFWKIGLITAIPYLITAATMPYWSARSDRAQERFWHSLVPMTVGAVGWIVAGMSSGAVAQLAALGVAIVTTSAVWSLFWTMPSAVTPRRAHAISIAALNTVGIMGATLSPLVIGYLRDATGGFSAGMYATGMLVLAGAALMLLVPRSLLRGSPRAAPAPAQ